MHGVPHAVVALQGEHTMTVGKANLEPLQRRTITLGHQVEARAHNGGYCRWRVWHRVGRTLVLGREHGVTLEAIATALDDLEHQSIEKQDEPAAPR